MDSPPVGNDWRFGSEASSRWRLELKAPVTGSSGSGDKPTQHWAVKNIAFLGIFRPT